MMVNELNNENTFYKRFNINVPIELARSKFVNRVSNLVVKGFFPELYWLYVRNINEEIATALGERIIPDGSLEYYTENEFWKTLRALEAVYSSSRITETNKYKFSKLMDSIIGLSEIDLGIEWTEGIFMPSGVKILDNSLINDNLKWLSDKKYKNVFDNFRDGLIHFEEANHNPQRLSDAVNDIYKAVESIAQAVTGKDWDLSKNRELFVKTLKLNENYSRMLHEYIEYANRLCRHGSEPNDLKLLSSVSETEAFIYLSGLFIRLAIKQIDSKPPS